MRTVRQLIEGLRGMVVEARKAAKAKAPVHRALAPSVGDYHSTPMGQLRRKKMAQDRDAPSGKSAGGEATMPGPKGAVDGRWVTVNGKGGKFRAARGVMPQKGQLGLPGIGRGKKKHEARTSGGRCLSEALAGILAEYKTPGWSTTPSGKGGKVWNVKPPGKKGVWRTVGGKHVFYPQDGSGPWGGSPARPGWTKKSGKFRKSAKKGMKGVLARRAKAKK